MFSVGINAGKNGVESGGNFEGQPYKGTRNPDVDFVNKKGKSTLSEHAGRGAATGASIEDFTAGPLYAAGKAKGRHQWAIEWEKKPDDTERFIEVLDTRLRELNSDYDAKRKGNLFLDAPEIINLEPGSFDRWLARVGSGKLGGQRKIPRLRNDRSILDAL